MLVPKETHSAKEDAIALRWGMCQNLHVVFSFLRQMESNCLCIYPAKSIAASPKRAGIRASEIRVCLPTPSVSADLSCWSSAQVLSFVSFQARLKMLPAYFIMYLGNQMRWKYFIKMFIINYELLNKYKIGHSK